MSTVVPVFLFAAGAAIAALMFGFSEDEVLLATGMGILLGLRLRDAQRIRRLERQLEQRPAPARREAPEDSLDSLRSEPDPADPSPSAQTVERQPQHLVGPDVRSAALKRAPARNVRLQNAPLPARSQALWRPRFAMD